MLLSVCLLRLADLLVNGLSAGKTLAGVVPVRNPLLSQLPAEQHGMAVNFAGEVEQADIEVLHLDSGGVDLSQGIFHARDGLFTLGFAASHVHYIDQ